MAYERNGVAEGLGWDWNFHCFHRVLPQGRIEGAGICLGR